MVTALPAMFEGPLSIADASAIATLREIFDRHGYTGTAAVDALGAPLPFGARLIR